MSWLCQRCVRIPDDVVSRGDDSPARARPILRFLATGPGHCHGETLGRVGRLLTREFERHHSAQAGADAYYGGKRSPRRINH